jgi:hypothetical protein
MGSKDPTPLKVIISHDRSRAELIVPGDLPREMVTTDLCRVELQQAGVQITKRSEELVAQLVAKLPPLGTEMRAVVAEGRKAERGSDGTLTWCVDPPAPPGADVLYASFYERSPYVMVKPGQVLGKLTKPTAGVDGIDVLGQTLPARAGKAVDVKFDDSITIAADGTLTANVEGVLLRSSIKAQVSKVLEVGANVDFSSGNVDFQGDVTVRGNVLDCFTVKTTGSVEVDGVIQAATIECGGDLIARGGMAGREKGRLNVSGSITARYLTSVQARCGGDVRIEREVMNCNLITGGSINAPNASIIGGATVITGASVIGSLGSVAASPTMIVLGMVPLFQLAADAARARYKELSDKLEALKAEDKKLREKHATRGGRLDPKEAERQTEMMFELHEAATAAEKAKAEFDAANVEVTERKTVDLRVERRIFPKVTIAAQGHRYEITREMRGPLRILLAANGEVCYQTGDSGPLMPLYNVARASSQAA